MRPVNRASGNGQKTGEEEKKVSFNMLESRIQHHLKYRAPNPNFLNNTEVEAFLSEFRESFPELDFAIDVAVMRRLMKSAVQERQKAKTARIKRRQLVPA